MERTSTVKWSSLKVGLVLVFAIAAMLWASLTGGGTSIFDSKGEFVCYFRNVSGLMKGSPVWMSGVEVGNVRSVEFVNIDSLRQVKVVSRVKKSVWPMLTEGCRVQLGTIGFLGDKYLEVIPGPRQGRVLEEMGVIPVRDAGSAEAMFKTGEAALDEASSLLGNLNDVVARMNRGEGTLGRMTTSDSLYIQMTRLLSNMAALTKSLHDNQERIIGSIEKTADAVTDLSRQVQDNSGSLGKIISDPQLYDNLAATSARLDTIMRKVQAAEGSLGLFISDTAFYSETINLMTRIGNLVSDIEENPRKYFKFSVF